MAHPISSLIKVRCTIILIHPSAIFEQIKHFSINYIINKF